MRKSKSSAFTLIELIVVITILAVLATIGYLSLLGYTQSARNSGRVSNIRIIQKALDLHIIQNAQYPTPDASVNISYSGGVAWEQGEFSTGALTQLGRVSNVPLDSSFGVPYSYSISTNKTKYQLGSVLEGALSFYPSLHIEQSYALSSENLYSYIVGDFISPDINVVNGTGCNLVSSPSIILSDIPIGGALTDGGTYNYSYLGSSHIPFTYSGSVTPSIPEAGFQTTVVLNNCEISSMGELELYIAKLSTSYQTLASLSKYRDLIYNPNTLEFKLASIDSLEKNGIIVQEAVKEALYSPLPDITFIDTFNDTNGILIGSHTPNTPLGSWSIIAGGNAGAYSISGNTLIKNDVSNTLIYPTTFPIVSTADYNVTFDIEDFSSGTASIYVRYVDQDNYYKVDISASGYQITRRLAGIDTTLQNINDPISIGSTIFFGISSETLVLQINEIEKESIVESSISSIGKALISLQNSGAIIDNYTFTYK